MWLLLLCLTCISRALVLLLSDMLVRRIMNLLQLCSTNETLVLLLYMSRLWAICSSTEQVLALWLQLIR